MYASIVFLNPRIPLINGPIIFLDFSPILKLIDFLPVTSSRKTTQENLFIFNIVPASRFSIPFDVPSLQHHGDDDLGFDLWENGCDDFCQTFGEDDEETEKEI
ncbi:hypothetical protein L2E82_01858 [Cichorium intybus]|uniref:Uncharacterized protein n=1 Tax=Cichorium intybus TaxID=13427 RepID=A0ACB9H1B0_CICIN|nr:hypothetical protein L2E82_01858 [Cichorium intybus]